MLLGMGVAGRARRRRVRFVYESIASQFNGFLHHIVNRCICIDSNSLRCVSIPYLGLITTTDMVLGIGEAEGKSVDVIFDCLFVEGDDEARSSSSSLYAIHH